MNIKKKFTAFITVLCTLCTLSAASAFNFPEPDWGALLREKTDMVYETDFELYTEGDVSSAPYYGARLEPRGGTSIGMITEHSAGFTPLGSYLTYIECNSQTDMYYPANDIIKNDNAAVMIGYNLASTGYVDYDSVRTTLNNLASYNKPMFIRFACEMNCSSLGDNPTEYVDVFRRVADMVHEYPNFAVVWSPVDIGALDRPFSYYYPGDGYVDWIGVSCYSFKYFQGRQNNLDKEAVYFMTGDYAWATNRLKPIIKFMEQNNIKKPVMISEGGVATNNQYGEDYAAWNTPRMRNMLYNVVMKYPQVKMINYFNNFRGGEVERFDITDYPYAAEIFSEAAACGAYIRQFGTNSEFVYEKADAGSTITAKNGLVNLYTLAYFAKKPGITVTYKIDGDWYHSSNQAPYKCSVALSSLSDGMHTVEISSEGTSKSYTMYKSGNAVRFGSEPDKAEAEITVSVNGAELSFDQPPVIINDRTLVPMRAIFESLGAAIEWDGDNFVVTARKDDKTIVLAIGSSTMYINDVPVQLDVPSRLINDKTMVPVRAVAEGLSSDVTWDEAQNKVIIQSK